ncbi:MAG: corrinoid protein [Nitrososphaeria archaeon]
MDLKTLRDMLLNYDVEGIKNVINKALESGLDPLQLIEKLTEEIRTIGDLFEKNQIFLTELMLAAESMKIAISLVEPKIRQNEQKRSFIGKVLIGTVEGDIHDIGKNIVATLLSVNGFEVIDLGVDVPTSRFIQKAKEIKPDIIAISALLTATMPKMKEVIDALKKEGLRNKVKVIVGGAPVTERWAMEIGADAYGANAVEAVKVAKKLLSSYKVDASSF